MRFDAKDRAKFYVKGFAPDTEGVDFYTINGKPYQGDWVVGFISIQPVKGHEECITCIAEKGKEALTKVFPSTIKRFSGVEDKNGEKIFEGDRVFIRTFDKNEGRTFTIENGVFLDCNAEEYFAGWHVRYNRGDEVICLSLVEYIKLIGLYGTLVK